MLHHKSCIAPINASFGLKSITDLFLLDGKMDLKGEGMAIR